MALDAGSVYAVLGFKVDPAGAAAYEARLKKSVAATEAAEARTKAAQDRMVAANKRFSDSVPLKAMDQWSQHSKKAGENLEKLGTVSAKTAGVGMLAVGAGMVYAAAKAVSFNREMLKISTQAGGSAGEVKKLSAAVLGLAGQVPQGPKELAEGLYHIESAGFRGAKSLELLKAAAMGAALGNASLEDTTQAMIATEASHIKGVHGAADAMGQLNAIVGVGDMRMEGLAQAMATGILPSAHDAGLSLTDVGAALATVTDNATPANVTATRLRMTLALMAAPSKEATKQLASIGIGSTQLAHDMRQPNGLLVAVEDLKTHLHNSGKTAEEQDAILSHVFGGGKSSAVIHTLLSEIDRLRTKYDELGKTDGPKRLAHSWAEFQKSDAGMFSELKSGAEGFAIVVGQLVLPQLASLAQEGAKALGQFERSGGAANVGHALTSGFDTAGQVISGLAPDVEALAKALYDVGHAASSVGQFFGLGLAGQVETVTVAFVALKAAAFAAPIVAAGLGAIANGLFLVSAAIEDGELLALPGILLGLANPLTLVAVAVGVAAAGFVAFQNGLFSGTSAAEKNAAAMQADKAAIESLDKAMQGAAQAHFAAQRAVLAHHEALENLKTVEREIHDGSLKGSAAQNALADAQLRVAESANQVTDTRNKSLAEIDKEIHLAEKATDTISGRQKETFKDIKSVDALIDGMKKRGATEQQMQPAMERLRDLQREYNKEAKEAAQANAEVAVSQESRKRVEAGKQPISKANAKGVQDLQNALYTAGAPKTIVTRYELEDQDAQSKLGTLAAKLDALGRGKTVAKILTTAPTAAVAVEALRTLMHGVPSSKVISILAKADSAKEQIAALRALIHGVPPEKVAKILTNASSEASKVNALNAAVRGLEGKEITITTVLKTVGAQAQGGLANLFAEGRPSGNREAAVVGEGQGPEYVVNSRTGQGAKVSGPMLAGLGRDDYVIPLEQRYRGRALGLFAMLAKDLQVPGYRHGRAPVRHSSAHHQGHHQRPAWTVPPHLDYLSVPVEDIQTKADASKQARDKAATKVKSDDSKVKSLEKHVRTIERSKKKTGLGEARKELATAKKTDERDKKQLAEAKKGTAKWQKLLKEAKAYQAKIVKQTDLANIEANNMRLADGHDDRGAYEAAKHRRLTALAVLKQLVADASTHVGADSEYARQLTQQIQNSELEGHSTEVEDFKPESNPAAEREEQSGMTDDEAARLREINKDIALAALTPDLGDDKASAQTLVGFLEGILGEAQAEPGPRGGDELIASLAGQVKTARENLKSLVSGGQNENANLQAQIDQAKQRTEVAQREAQIANQALSVLGGSGDIGSGGRSALGAAAGVVIHQTVNTLHPGDPAVLKEIGAAATAGIGYQGARRATTWRPGI